MTEVSTFRCLKKAGITIKAIILEKKRAVLVFILIYHIFNILWICPIYGAHFVNNTKKTCSVKCIKFSEPETMETLNRESDRDWQKQHREDCEKRDGKKGRSKHLKHSILITIKKWFMFILTFRLFFLRHMHSDAHTHTLSCLHNCTLHIAHFMHTMHSILFPFVIRFLGFEHLTAAIQNSKNKWKMKKKTNICKKKAI